MFQARYCVMCNSLLTPIFADIKCYFELGTYDRQSNTYLSTFFINLVGNIALSYINLNIKIEETLWSLVTSRQLLKINLSQKTS